MKNKLNYKIIPIIIVTSIGLGILYNLFSSDSLSFIRHEIKVNFTDDTLVVHNNSGITLRGIRTEKVFELFQDNKVTFIDARDQWEFGDGHIPGAINIPEFSFEPDDPKLDSLERDKLYIVYCEGDDCDISKRLAVELSKLGFTNLYVYLDGFYEWIDNNFPVESE